MDTRRCGLGTRGHGGKTHYAQIVARREEEGQLCARVPRCRGGAQPEAQHLGGAKANASSASRRHSVRRFVRTERRLGLGSTDALIRAANRSAPARRWCGPGGEKGMGVLSVPYSCVSSDCGKGRSDHRIRMTNDLRSSLAGRESSLPEASQNYSSTREEAKLTRSFSHRSNSESLSEVNT
ncbi:hypothetical protein A0H81_04525 [Grifola frondosa]|uniref:Uncharacterized protein n=1 Tax=Grifola frondosa TaxID=5627 RepID=A0A1C7ME80_GRIFR|nr:hypothetical protein A0H81_04525 [Grifola frondosa]